MRHILFLVIFSYSCAEEQSEPQVNFSQEELTIDVPIDLNTSSYDKRRRLPLLHVLYDEAKKRDSRLATLDEAILGMATMNKDSLKDYQSFENYNKNYYRSAHDYLGTILDTTAKVRVSKLLDESEEAFSKMMIPYRESDMEIKNLQKQLSDQHTMMEIMVSELMIRSYQQNSPDLEKLKELEQKYKKLLSETAEYTKYQQQN